ncbi:hypothetical protein [Arthrobacter sp. PAMC25284]|uniref:hypothetical protein n=1 Tax=Arthrobacter sp. PAMC25284 TaxID=2861279 RepID=UPI002158BB5E|nr:hypothetical protein [Arthrobacter sp. PAMC25284]
MVVDLLIWRSWVLAGNRTPDPGAVDYLGICALTAALATVVLCLCVLERGRELHRSTAAPAGSNPALGIKCRRRAGRQRRRRRGAGRLNPRLGRPDPPLKPRERPRRPFLSVAADTVGACGYCTLRTGTWAGRSTASGCSTPSAPLWTSSSRSSGTNRSTSS